MLQAPLLLISCITSPLSQIVRWVVVIVVVVIFKSCQQVRLGWLDDALGWQPRRCPRSQPALDRVHVCFRIAATFDEAVACTLRALALVAANQKLGASLIRVAGGDLGTGEGVGVVGVNVNQRWWH